MTAPRLYLDLSQADAIAAEAVLRAHPVAAVLLRGAAAPARSAVAALQKTGAAVLLDTTAEAVRATGADGLHATGPDAARAACGLLKPDLIVGAGGLATRHDAMIAGEAGADYVLFGEPQPDATRPALAAVLERIAWWQSIFAPPCVGYAATHDEITLLARAGADFILLARALWPNGIPTADGLRAAEAALAAEAAS